MNSKTIWEERQNKPSLVVRDLAHLVDEDTVFEVLLRRGVFKWLAVRRQLIRLKDLWKGRVTQSIELQKMAVNGEVNYWRGYRKAVEECRAEVRALCHGERWRAPDFDRDAKAWLEQRGERE